MIERYSWSEMARVWSEERKLDTWLRVESLVCDGWAREGAISPADLERIHSRVLLTRHQPVTGGSCHCGAMGALAALTGVTLTRVAG
jgi:hypothetical protein